MRDPIVRAYCALAAAIVIRAIQDAHAETGHSSRRWRRSKAHIYAADAVAFLQSERCADILETLGLSSGKVAEVLAHPLPDIRKAQRRGR